MFQPGPRGAGGGQFDHHGQHRGQRDEQGGRERVPEVPALVGADRAGRRTSPPCRPSSGSPWAGSASCPPWPKGAAYTELTWDDSTETADLGEEGRLPGPHPGSDGQGRRGPAAHRAAGAGAGGLADPGQGGRRHLHHEQRGRADHERRRRAVQRDRGRRRAGTPTCGRRRSRPTPGPRSSWRCASRRSSTPASAWAR